MNAMEKYWYVKVVVLVMALVGVVWVMQTLRSESQGAGRGSGSASVSGGIRATLSNSETPQPPKDPDSH